MKLTDLLPVLKNLVMFNLGWKVLSLCVAIMIFYFFSTTTRHDKERIVMVETRFDAKKTKTVVASYEPRSVKVIFRGSQSDISKLNSADISCILRPKQPKKESEERTRIKFKNDDLKGVPFGLRVFKFEPSHAVVFFDTPSNFRLPIAAPVTIGKARGKVELEFDPKFTDVTVSDKLRKSLKLDTMQIHSEPVDVEGRSQDFMVDAKLLLPDDAATAIIKPDTIKVKVKIQQRGKETTTVPGVPVRIVGAQPLPDFKWLIEPETVEVNITGSPETVNNIVFSDILASVNAIEAPATLNVTNELSVIVYPKYGLVFEELRVRPEKVKVSLIAINNNKGIEE